MLGPIADSLKRFLENRFTKKTRYHFIFTALAEIHENLFVILYISFLFRKSVINNINVLINYGFFIYYS